MSVLRAVLIECDGCGIIEPQDNVQLQQNATELRRDLAREGWKVRLADGRDLCADCVEGSQ